VVDVEVHDGDALDAAADRCLGGERDIVEETEAHRGVWARVMARRTHQADRPVRPVTNRNLSGSDAASSGKQCGIARSLCGDRVHAEGVAAVSADAPQVLQVVGVVEPLNLLGRGGPKLQSKEAVYPARLL